MNHSLHSDIALSRAFLAVGSELDSAGQSSGHRHHFSRCRMALVRLPMATFFAERAGRSRAVARQAGAYGKACGRSPQVFIDIETWCMRSPMTTARCPPECQERQWPE